MIDILSENLVSLADAAKLLPRRRGGKRVHQSCIYRWCLNGLKGVVLESIQIGGTRCTSKEALTRFFNRLSDTTPARVLSEPSVSRSNREKVIAAANAVLDRAGI